jgi:hypothetical protein
MNLKHITNHKKVMFSLYRSNLRVAHLMGYKYGNACSRFIQDLSLCDSYIRSGKLIEYPNKYSLLIGTTIRMHYKMSMYSVTASSTIFIDRSFYWLRVLNSLYNDYRVKHRKQFLLPSPPKRKGRNT